MTEQEIETSLTNSGVMSDLGIHYTPVASRQGNQLSDVEYAANDEE